MDTIYQESIRPAIEVNEINLYFAEKLSNPAKIPGSLSSEVSSVDFVVADISESDPEVSFYLGLAKALSKTIITLCRHDGAKHRDIMRCSDFHLDYDATPEGVMELYKNMQEVLEVVVKSSKLDDYGISGYAGSRWQLSWEEINQLDYENLLHELLLREGFEEVRWREEGSHINSIALKPQGIKTREISIFCIGSVPGDYLDLQSWMSEFENDILVVMHDLYRRGGIFRLDGVIVVTVWFVWSPRGSMVTDDETLRSLIKAIEKADPGNRVSARYGVWNRQYIENLLKEHPTLTRKYLGKNLHPDSGRQKNLEDLYKETVRCSQQDADLAKRVIEKYDKEPEDFWQNIAFTATHSIGNALFPIEINADLLIKKMGNQADGETLDMIKEIKDYTEQAKSRIARFKNFASRSAPRILPVDIRKHIDKAMQVAERSDIATSIYCDSTLPRVDADPDKLDEILSELVENSRKWLTVRAERSISITIKVRDCGDTTEFLRRQAGRFVDKFLWVTFSDNGPGIQSELKEKIFQLFYSRDPQGMGFGLGIVRKNMRDFGGDVIEAGTPGAGVRFELFFPISRNP